MRRICLSVFFLTRRPPPRSSRTDTLVPDTTLFRSGALAVPAGKAGGRETGATLPDNLASALGGSANVRSVHALHGRYRVELADAAQVDEGALARLTRGLVRPQPNVCHILI